MRQEHEDFGRFSHTDSHTELWVVSDLQLYLDLHNYPIRELEQAEHPYEQ